MKRRVNVMTLMAGGQRPARFVERVSANTPEGARILKESFQRDMREMTRESALAALARTGMYDNQGRIKEEYR